MARSRFFPNTLPDYPETEGTIETPISYLTNQLQLFTSSISRFFEPTGSNAADGLYLGTAGVSYMYYHLSKIPELGQYRKEFLDSCLKYLKPSLQYAESHADEGAPSLLLGNCGIYAVGAAFFNAMGDKSSSERYKKLVVEAGSVCKKPGFLKCGSDEFFVGRAGYILGSLWLSKELNSEINRSDLYELCKITIESGRTYSRNNGSPCPLMYAYYGVEYLGAAHGLCAILQAILSVPGYLSENPQDAADVKSSVDFLLTLQDRDGNFPAAMDESGGAGNDLVHWCHGAPGVIYLMAKAYLTWREEKYLRACLPMSDLIWERGLLHKGPGLCHGVAGNGYAFLLLYRLTKNLKFLHRAIAFAQFLEKDSFKRKARTPDNPFSLYEGIAGTACYVGDLMSPDQAVFPFFDVFV